MRYLIISVLLFLRVIQGQSIDSLVAQLPSCSLPCLKKIYEAGGCKAKDYSCGCNLTGSSLESLTAQCFVAACSSSDILTFQSLSIQICLLVSTEGVSSSINGILASVTSSLLGATSTIATVFTAAGSTYTVPLERPTLATSFSSQPGFQTRVSSSAATDGQIASGSPSSSSSNGKSSLPTGAAVGVGVGATLVGLAIVAAIIIFCMRYRKRGRELKQLEVSHNPQVVTEQKVAEVREAPVQQELDGKEADVMQKHVSGSYLRNQGYGNSGGGMPSELGDQSWGTKGPVELQGQERP